MLHSFLCLLWMSHLLKLFTFMVKPHLLYLVSSQPQADVMLRGSLTTFDKCPWASTFLLGEVLNQITLSSVGLFQICKADQSVTMEVEWKVWGPPCPSYLLCHGVTVTWHSQHGHNSAVLHSTVRLETLEEENKLNYMDRRQTPRRCSSQGKWL